MHRRVELGDVVFDKMYVDAIIWREPALKVILTDGLRGMGELDFGSVRTFWHFILSDFDGVFGRIPEREKLVATRDGNVGLYKVRGTDLLEKYNNLMIVEELNEEADSYFLLTPQVCIEVICFDPPILQIVAD